MENEFKVNSEITTEENEQKFTLLGVEMSLEEFDFLLCEQAKGKELKVVGGKVVAEYHTLTAEELKQHRICEFKEELAQIKEDIEQENFGLVRDDYGAKKARAAKIINELRVLEGKEPRPIKTE